MGKTSTRNRDAYKGLHILTDSYAAKTDTWETGINNNVLVFGPSGAGKTRHYVRPNLLSSHESMVIIDTKGSLYGEVGPTLKAKGYKVMNIDFADLASGTGYNPFDYIRRDPKTGRYLAKDIMTIACCTITDKDIGKDPFWENAARQYLACLTAYVLETMPKKDHHFGSVVRMLGIMGSDHFQARMEELKMLDPDSFAVYKYESFKDNGKAEKMDASIRGILSSFTDPLAFDEALAMYKKRGRIDLSTIGKRKTALFLTISDTDRSMDKLVNMFLTQTIQVLCRTADKDFPEHRLPVPVRFYLDDFATNCYIPDFDKIISVIRSREISVSVILQSLTQLESLYGEARSRTILNNCDRQLYLGGQDVDTAEYISRRINRPLDRVLNIPVGSVYLLERGQEPVYAEKFDRDATGHSSGDRDF